MNTSTRVFTSSRRLPGRARFPKRKCSTKAPCRPASFHGRHHFKVRGSSRANRPISVQASTTGSRQGSAPSSESHMTPPSRPAKRRNWNTAKSRMRRAPLWKLSSTLFHEKNSSPMITGGNPASTPGLLNQRPGRSRKVQATAMTITDDSPLSSSVAVSPASYDRPACSSRGAMACTARCTPPTASWLNRMYTAYTWLNTPSAAASW